MYDILVQMKVGGNGTWFSRGKVYGNQFFYLSGHLDSQVDNIVG
jgi:hypothetical protein